MLVGNFPSRLGVDSHFKHFQLFFWGEMYTAKDMWTLSPIVDEVVSSWACIAILNFTHSLCYSGTDDVRNGSIGWGKSLISSGHILIRLIHAETGWGSTSSLGLERFIFSWLVGTVSPTPSSELAGDGGGAGVVSARSRASNVRIKLKTSDCVVLGATTVPCRGGCYMATWYGGGDPCGTIYIG